MAKLLPQKVLQDRHQLHEVLEEKGVGVTVNLLADVADVDVDDVTTVGRVVVVHDVAVDAELASISPIFYEQLFCTKVICAAFMCLQIGFVIFWQKDFGAKLLINCW